MGLRSNLDEPHLRDHGRNRYLLGRLHLAYPNLIDSIMNTDATDPKTQSFNDLMDARTQNFPVGSVYAPPKPSVLNVLLLRWNPWFLLREYVLIKDPRSGSHIPVGHKLWVKQERQLGVWYSSFLLQFLAIASVLSLRTLQLVTCGPFVLFVWLVLPQPYRDAFVYKLREADWVHYSGDWFTHANSN